MDDASGQLGNNGTEIGYLVSGKNGVRFAIRKMAELPPRGAVIQPLTQFVLHSLDILLSAMIFSCICDIYEWLSDRDNMKDFVWPLLTSFLAVLGAYAIFRAQVYNENRQKKDKLNVLSDMIGTVNKKAVTHISEWRKILKEMFDTATLEEYQYQPVHAFDTSLFAPITSLTYGVIYELSHNHLNIDVPVFEKYWESISSLSNQLDRLMDYQKTVTTNFNFQNEKLNGSTREILIRFDELPDSDFKRLLYDVFRELNQRQKEKMHLGNIKWGLDSIVKICNGVENKSSIPFEFIQLINDGLDAVFNIQTIMANYKASIMNYQVILVAVESNVNHFQKQNVKINEV